MSESNKFGFVRAHVLPRICKKPIELWGYREVYLCINSYERYLKTEDGIYLTSAVKNMKPEIGSVDDFRFIESPEL